MTRVVWRECEWVCLPERALWWPAQRALICADLHAGKDEAFRRAGVPLPDGGLADDLARLSDALARVSAERLFILGDFFHARTGRGPRVVAVLADWRARHASLEVTLVRGNHDRAAGDPPKTLRIRAVRRLILDGFDLRHEPSDRVKPANKPFIAGHLHPVARLPACGGHVALPCFWFGARGLTLPAFSSLAGGLRIRPAASDQVVVIAPDGSLVQL